MPRSETAGEAVTREATLRAAIHRGEAAPPPMPKHLITRLTFGGPWASEAERADFLRWVTAGGSWGRAAYLAEDAYISARLSAESLPLPELTREAWDREARAYLERVGLPWDPERAAAILDSRRPAQEVRDADPR